MIFNRAIAALALLFANAAAADGVLKDAPRAALSALRSCHGVDGNSLRNVSSSRPGERYSSR